MNRHVRDTFLFLCLLYPEELFHYRRGCTPLMLAVRNENIMLSDRHVKESLLSALLTIDPQLSAQRDVNGYLPLAHAVMARNQPWFILQMLVESHVDALNDVTNGLTTFQLAASYDCNLDTIYGLLRLGPNMIRIS